MIGNEISSVTKVQRVTRLSQIPNACPCLADGGLFAPLAANPATSVLQPVSRATTRHVSANHQPKNPDNQNRTALTALRETTDPYA